MTGYPETELTVLRAQLHRVAARRAARRTRTTAIALALALFCISSAAFASARGIFFDHSFTPADVQRQATTVEGDRWLDCAGSGCVMRSGTHRQVDIQPWMGITFVLPSGFPVRIYPASAGLGPLPTQRTPELSKYGLPGLDERGRFQAGTVETHAGGGRWTVELADGKRTIVWDRSGTASLETTSLKGRAFVVPLEPGDVVSLVPGLPAAGARTAEKAVTVDLPVGAQVFILPGFNETYVGALPEARGARDSSLPRGAASFFGLQADGDYGGHLPVGAMGGSWTVTQPGGGTRVIEWRAGGRGVFVIDHESDGSTRREFVPVGREIPLVPPK